MRFLPRDPLSRLIGREARVIVINGPENTLGVLRRSLHLQATNAAHQIYGVWSKPTKISRWVVASGRSMRLERDKHRSYLGNARIEFFKNSIGAVTHFTRAWLEGDLEYLRKPDRK